MRWRNFNEWKTYATSFLLELRRKHEDDNKIRSDIDVLLSKLHYLRGRDLGNFLHYCHIIIRDDGVKELYEIIPTPEEVAQLILSE